jgi:putative SOS response-associated peptidase YedK
MNRLEKQPLTLKRLLMPAPSDLLVTQQVSMHTSSVKNDSPELLKSNRVRTVHRCFRISPFALALGRR